MDDNDNDVEESDDWLEKEIAKYENVKSENEFLDIFNITEDKIYLKDRKDILCFADHNGNSVLSFGTVHRNFEFVKFLISTYSSLIQQLPYENKEIISANLHSANEFDLLCDLVEFSDYPFPNEFDKESCDNERLKTISEERMKFHEAILSQDFDKIDEFIEKNGNLKYVFNYDNMSALEQARKSKIFDVFFYLKSEAFQATEFDEYSDDLDDDVIKSARKEAIKQREKNVRKSCENIEKPVLLLIARSRIHNLKENKMNEKEYRTKIKEWFKAINRVKWGDWILKTACQCEALVIIFDFQSNSVEYVDPSSSKNTAGVTYPRRKWIMIGAKYENEADEQKIKGVIAHELCHYILGIVFENNDNPYYRNNNKIREEFKNIVKRIKSSLFNSLALNEEETANDDGCDGIISSVYSLYNPKDHPAELIVRVVQILAQYDKVKSDELENRYEILFYFFEKYVLPELESFNLKNRLKIRKFNEKSEILSKIKKEEFKLKNTNTSFMEDKNTPLTVVYCNIPELVYSCIYANIKNQGIVDVKNIFINSQALDDKKVFTDVDNILKEIKDIKIFIDCTENISENIKDLVKDKEDINIIMVTTNEKRIEFQEILNKINQSPKVVPVDFKFADLSNESELKILQAEIKFQSASTTFFDLLSPDEDIEILKKYNIGLIQDPPIISKIFENIIDEELLKLFIKEETLNINPSEREKFDHKMQLRKFHKNHVQLANEEFLNDVENKNIVFITGDYGCGKSWTLRYLTNTLCLNNPKLWILYIDLQHYAEDFISSKLNCYDFIVEIILKLKNNLEIKLFNFLYQKGKIILLLDDINHASKDVRKGVNKLVSNLKADKNNKILIATRNIKNWDDSLQKQGTEHVVSEFRDESKNNYFDDYFSEDEIKQKFVKNAKKLINELLKINKHVNKPIFCEIIATFVKHSENRGYLSIFHAIGYHVNNLFSKIQNCSNDILNDQHCSLALKELFPKRFCFRRNNFNFELYGLVTKNGSKYCFVNNVFRDFFITKYLLSTLMEGKIDEKFRNTFKSVLHSTEHSGIRNLFNNALSNNNLCPNIKMKNFNFSNDFNLSEIIIIIIKEDLYNFIKILEIMFGDTKSDIIVECLININPVENFQVFKIVKALLKLLKPESAGSYIINEEIFQKLICSDIPINEVKIFARELDKMRLVEYLRKGLQVLTKNTGANIVHIACKKPFIIKQTFHLLTVFLSRTQFIDLLLLRDKNGNTFLHKFAQNNQQKNKLNCDYHNSKQISIKTNLNYYKEIWKKVFKYFDEQELKELMLAKNNKGQTFFHICIIQNKAEVIKEILEILKDKNELCKQILSNNHFKHRNLLQIAANESFDIATHEVLWTIYRNHYQANDNLIEIIKASDEDDKSILELAVGTTTKTFNFLLTNIEEIFKNLNQDKENILKDFFASIDDKEMNLLQLAAKENKSIDFHINLWEQIEKYFEDKDICELINFVDEKGWSMLIYARKYNTTEVKGFIQNKVRNFNISFLGLNPEAETEEDNESTTARDEVQQQNQQPEPNDFRFKFITFLKSKKKYFLFFLFFLFFLLLILFINSNISLNFNDNKAPFYKRSPEDQLKIKESRVLYKKINVKLDNLLYNSIHAYDKFSNENLNLLRGKNTVNLDDPQFFDVTSMISHKFDNLDNNLIEKIYNSIFLFNNEPFKFEFISKLYPKVLQFLTSEQILSILDVQILKVGQMVEKIEPLNILEKNDDFSSFFLKYLKLSEEQYDIINRGSLDKIINEDSNKFKLFILKQEDINNQLISFDLDSITKLKKKFPKYWISYIDLRESLKYFSERENMETPFSILKQFVNLNDDFEKQLFLLSYNSGQLVLLWDGFDKIPIKYREIVVNLISYINQNTPNVQVVSAQLSFKNLKEDDQNTIKKSLVTYKNAKLKLNELFPKNTEVYKDIIPKHALKILNNEILNLSDPEFEYLEKFVKHSWDSLDKSLKDKVLNSDLIFQNNKIKFKVIDQLYPEIFASLTSEQICHILDGKVIEIGKMIKNPIDPKLFDKKVKSLNNNNPDEKICSNNSFWNHLEQLSLLKDNYELVINENLGELIKIGKSQNRQFFILTLETPLEVVKGFDQNSIQNIKERYPFHLIAYINRLTLNDYVRKQKETIYMHLMLEEMFGLSLESEFEKKFIMSSYNSGRFIFFWDGFFEETESNKLLIKIISLIYNETQNIQFISSQVSCQERIEHTNDKPEQISAISNTPIILISIIMSFIVLLVVSCMKK